MYFMAQVLFLLVVFGIRLCPRIKTNFSLLRVVLYAFKIYLNILF